MLILETPRYGTPLHSWRTNKRPVKGLVVALQVSQGVIGRSAWRADVSLGHLADDASLCKGRLRSPAVAEE